MGSPLQVQICIQIWIFVGAEPVAEGPPRTSQKAHIITAGKSYDPPSIVSIIHGNQYLWTSWNRFPVDPLRIMEKIPTVLIRIGLERRHLSKVIPNRLCGQWSSWCRMGTCPTSLNIHQQRSSTQKPQCFSPNSQSFILTHQPHPTKNWAMEPTG